MLAINSLSPFESFYFVLFSAIIGLCVGSFLNVVILRGLSGESIVLPPSKCPKCNEQLRWYDNIPVLSYIILRGKCRFCKEHISLQYPIVEFLTSVLFVLMLLKFDFTLTTLFMWAIVALFVVMSLTDLKEQVILTRHAYILAAIGIVYNLVVNHDILTPVLGLITGVLVMELLARTGIICIGSRAFGEGDSYIAGAIGAIIGWKWFLYSLAIAVVLQTVMILPAFIFNMFKYKKYKLLMSFACFALLTIYLFNDTTFHTTIFTLHTLLIVVLAVLGISIVGQVFDFTRNTTLKTIPFGPAMLIGAFICIYFDKFISSFIF